MATRNHLSDREKQRILMLFHKGKSKIDIARLYNINRCVVTKIIKRFDERGTVRTARRNGRPRKTTIRTGRKIVRMSKKDPFLTSTEIRNRLDLLEISSKTVSRRLIENGLFSRIASRILSNN